jgi:integrase
MDELKSRGAESSKIRYKRAMRAKEFDLIRNRPIIKTTAEDLRAVLKRGGNATNNFLRRLHNIALENNWIPVQIIPAKKWDKTAKKQKRSITQEEHERILAAERHVERRHYYEMLWLIGASQSDGVQLKADNLDWSKRVLTYKRLKTGQFCHLAIGDDMEKLLKQLPKEGFLFPYMASLENKDRSAEFGRRCRLLGIKGISLHSYRYAWAERAYELGYAERFAQAALGHKSRAIHYGYAKDARVVCPALGASKDKIIYLGQETVNQQEGTAKKEESKNLSCEASG